MDDMYGPAAKHARMAVYTGACLLGLVLGSCTAASDKTPDTYEQVQVRLTRPQMCADLSIDPDPETWDPVTETYPRNEAWEKCMGVERR